MKQPIRRVTLTRRRDAIAFATEHAARGFAVAIVEHELTCRAQSTRLATDCDCTPVARIVTPESEVRR